jgi:hypothetical protein
MRTLQIFESTIFSDTTDQAVHVLVAPARSFVEPGDLKSPEALIRELDLKKIGPVSPTNLVFALDAMVGVDECGRESPEGVFEFLRAQTVPIAHPTQAPPEVTFAEQIAFSDLIPFEQSPLNLESLVGLVTKATGVAMGAYAGFVMSGGTPLIFVTVPAGMIIFGAAAGVAKALEEGLRERLLNLLRGSGEKADNGKSAKAKAVKHKSDNRTVQAVEHVKTG